MRLLRCLEFGCLNVDRDTREKPVVPAMVEVKVSVDDGGDIADGYTRFSESVRELNAPGLVQAVDQSATRADPGIDEDTSVVLPNQEAVDSVGARPFRMEVRKLELRETDLLKRDTRQAAPRAV